MHIDRSGRRAAAALESAAMCFLGGACHFVGFLAGIFSDDWQEACNRAGDAFYNRAEWALIEAERQIQKERDIVRQRKFLRNFAYPLAALVDLSMQLTWILRTFPNLLPFFTERESLEEAPQGEMDVDSGKKKPLMVKGILEWVDPDDPRLKKTGTSHFSIGLLQTTTRTTSNN